MSKGFLALHRIIPKYGMVSYAYTTWQFCPKQSCVLSWNWFPAHPIQLALRVQMHELRMCPMLVLNSYLRSQDPMSCMQRKCKASKMPGAGLCNSPCACSGGGSTGLRLCNSESLCRPTTRVVASPRETFPTRALFNNRKAPSFLA